jgi:adenosine deaminase
MVEDICNLLNNGEIASLWNVEDKAKLLEEVDSNGLPNEKYQ